MPKVVVGRWRQETAFVPHCIVRISLVFYFSDKNEQNRSTVFEKLSLLIVHFQKRSKNGVQTLFWMIAQYFVSNITIIFVNLQRRAFFRLPAWPPPLISRERLHLAAWNCLQVFGTGSHSPDQSMLA